MGSTIAIAALIAPAQAASLTAWNFDPNTNHLEVTVKDGTTPRYFLMAQPARIVMDLPGTSIAGVKTQGSYSGAVRQVRVSQFQPGMTRIVLELSPGVKLASGQVNLQKMDATRWVLKPLLAESPATVARSSPPAPSPAPAARPPIASVLSQPSSSPQPSAPQPSTIAVPLPLSRPTVAAAAPAAIVPPALPQKSAPQPSLSAPTDRLPAQPIAAESAPQAVAVPPGPPEPVPAIDSLPAPDPSPAPAQSPPVTPPAKPGGDRSSSSSIGSCSSASAACSTGF